MAGAFQQSTSKCSTFKVRRLSSSAVYKDSVNPSINDLSFSLLFSVPQQSKRLSTPAIALRSKSMTSELEEMGKDRDENEEVDRKGYRIDVETERADVHMGEGMSSEKTACETERVREMKNESG